MAVERSKLDTIQVLRAIAVAAVVLSHSFHELAQLFEGKVAGFQEKAFPGDFGVDLFFVISGFIMVFVSYNAFGTPGASVRFALRRIVRIVPLYWIMTSVMIAVVVLLPGSVDTATSDPKQWLASYLFVPYARASDGLFRPVLGLGWSLNYEMFFYALFSIGLLFRRRFAIPAVIAALVVAWLAGRLIPGLPGAVAFLTQPIILEFAVGMVLGTIYMQGFRIPRWVAFALLGVGTLLLFRAPAFNSMVEETRHLYYGIPAMLMVAGAILGMIPEHTAGITLAVGAGDASYSTYLTHPFVLGALTLIAGKTGLADMTSPSIFSAGFLLAALFASFITGYLVHRFLDGPLTGWLTRQLALQSPRPVTAP